jgi:class 3 adenylate cyclase/tetratricopeptide (TPR) repeat protein
MTFEEVVDQATAMLQRRGRVAYGLLKRHFNLDDDALQDLKEELIYGQQLAADEDSLVLVWTGATGPPSTQSLSAPASESQPAAARIMPARAEPRPPGAERRQLTVMFCDLVDSTPLSEQLDPEELRDVVQAYQHTCAEVVQRFEGHIAQLLGDALLVYFGWPQAHEDDAQRAVRTGLGMLQAMQTLNTRLQEEKGIRLAIRVGLHTGLVVVGEMGGGGYQEQLALGETPNIASRVQGIAAPDTVTISGATYRLIEGYFTFQTLGEQTLRGMAQPVPVYRVLGVSGAQSRFDIATSAELTPLVGREEKIGMLRARWAQSKDGVGQALLLSGEAGIGKSRLVQVLKDHAAEEPHILLECRSSPYYQNTALFPVRELFQQILQRQPEDSPETVLGELERMLRQHRLSLEETVPLLAGLLSLPVSEDRYPPLQLTPQRQRQKTLETIVAIVFGLSGHRPVLFILEDLHWTDPTTVELLDLLIAGVPTAALMLLLTCRPGFEPTWRLHTSLTSIALGRLPRLQTETMVKRVVGRRTLPSEVMQHLVQKTDGVPLYVEEMTKAILESGVLQKDDRNYTLTGSLASLGVPTTLQDSLMARLDRLSTAKSVAQHAAVIGRHFTYALLQAVSELDDATLQRELRRLVEAGLLYQQGLPPSATYTFKHSLIQEIGYQSLLRRVRQQYHQRITRALKDRFPKTVETQPELIAYHLTEAGLGQNAVEYWIAAAHRALPQAAWQEASSFIERGLAARPEQAETPQALAHTVDLYRLKYLAQYPLGNTRSLIATLEKSERFALKLDDSIRLSTVLSSQTYLLASNGEVDAAIAVGQRNVELISPDDDLQRYIAAKCMLGRALYAAGRYTEAIHHITEAMEVCGDDIERGKRVDNLLNQTVSTRVWLVLLHAERGEFEQGLRLGHEALQLAQGVQGGDHERLWVRSAIGRLRVVRGDFEAAIQTLEPVVLVSERDFPVYIPRVVSSLGIAYAASGSIEKGLRLLHRAEEKARSMSFRFGYALVLAQLAEVLLMADNVGEARTQAMQALAIAQEVGERGNAGWAAYTIGDVAARNGRHEDAASSYHRSLEIAESLEMAPLRTRCLEGLRRLAR